MAKRKKKDQVAEQPAVQEEAAVAPAPIIETTATVIQETPKAEEPKKHAASQYPDPNKPFSITHNNVAGVRLLKFDRFKQVQLHFRDDLPRELADKLQEGGWTYRKDEDVFTKQYGSRGEPLALLEAKRLYNRLVEELTPEGAARGR